MNKLMWPCFLHLHTFYKEVSKSYLFAARPKITADPALFKNFTQL